MNILVDLTQIPVNKVGVGVYALQTFSRIIAQDHSNRYFFVVQSDDPELCAMHSNRLTIVKVNARLFRNFAFRTLMEHFYLPYLKLKHHIKIIHSLHYSFPLMAFGAKRVVTVHDMTFYKYPELHTKIKRYYFKFFIWLSTKRASKIAVVSKSTGRDLIEQYPRVDPKKIVCTELASQIPQSIGNSPYEPPYVSFIGTLEPRKNITRLIEAFAQISQHESFGHYKLIVVGKKGWYYDSIFQAVERLKIQDKVLFTGFVTDPEKFAILGGSELFVYPSLYEGFGLPVLEALALGIPTITSNVSSMPEVAGDAALLIDPNRTQAIANAMIDVLSNTQQRQKMKQRGWAQASVFSWDKTAEKTICIYQSLQ